MLAAFTVTLPKSTEEADVEMAGGVSPVPLNATVCLRNSSLTVSVPDAAPVLVGANAICIEQVM